MNENLSKFLQKEINDIKLVSKILKEKNEKHSLSAFKNYLPANSAIKIILENLEICSYEEDSIPEYIKGWTNTVLNLDMLLT